MTTREEALEYGMSFPDVYLDTPFHDLNWVLVRSRKNKRAVLWTYEYQGQMRINVKADTEWIDFWRKAYKAVLPGYHQNKKHWNTVILDGSVPDADIRRMIAESYDLVTGVKKEKKIACGKVLFTKDDYGESKCVTACDRYAFFCCSS